MRLICNYSDYKERERERERVTERGRVRERARERERERERQYVKSVLTHPLWAGFALQTRVGSVPVRTGRSLHT